MELTTDRCHIRNIKISDVDDLYQVYSDESVIECNTKQIVSKKIAIKNRFVYESKEGNLERYRLVLDER